MSLFLVSNKDGKTVGLPELDKSSVFLQNIFGKMRNAYVELRLIRDNEVQTVFTRSFKKGLNWIAIEDMNVNGYNVFFSVCGRKEKKGTSEAVSVVPCLWLDIDNVDDKRTDELCSLWYTKDDLPIPSYVIKSGHGLHIYWILERPFRIKNDSDIRKISGYLHGLANYLHADRCYDLARVMRVPETLNWKYPDYPVESEIYLDHWENCDIVRYSLSLFDKYWSEPAIARSTKKLTFDKNTPMPDLSRLSQGIRNLITNPPPKGERSNACFIVMKAMQNASYNHNEIKAVFMNNPIGDRYAE